MDPVSVYLAGALVTTLAAGPTLAAAPAVAAVASPGPAAVGLVWPVAVPLGVVHGGLAAAGHALTPAMPSKLDLMTPESQQAPASLRLSCATQEIPFAEIDAAGGFFAFVNTLSTLQKFDIPMGQDIGTVTSRSNWRGGSLWEDPAGFYPSVKLDWVGNSTDDAGQEVAALRACTLRPLKGGAQ